MASQAYISELDIEEIEQMIDKSVQKFRNIDWKIQQSNLKTYKYHSESDDSSHSLSPDQH